VLKKRYQPLDSYQRKGKIYSIIDYVIFGSAIIFEKYHRFPLRPYRPPIRPIGTLGTSDIREIGLTAVSAMIMILAWNTTSSLNRHELVPEYKKHIAGIEHFFFFLAGFFILIFTADPLIGLLSRTIPVEKITYHLERLYFLHFFMMFYVLLRCVLAFDYYQAFYYEDRKCRMYHVLLCFFVGIGIIHILLGVLSLVVSFIYHF
jgi:hypothetical protein